jgi:predicted dehydrogenase
MSESLNRREFLYASWGAVAGLAATIGASPQNPVRCGFVGVGGRGTALLTAMLKVPGVEIPAICDIDPAARTKACDRVTEAHGKRPDEVVEWRKLLDRPDITSVAAALPCYLHYPMYRDALLAKKHLYGEKPLCLSVAHADDLVKLAGSSGTVFQIGFQRRFSKQLGEAARLVRDGSIGVPFDGRGGRFASQPIRNPGEWFSFREKSGDWMLEQAVHNWDAFTWALGALPVSAYGSGRQDIFKDRYPERDVSDYYTCILQYANGLSLTWVHSWATPSGPAFSTTYEQLVGSKGAVDLAKGMVGYREGPDDKRTRQIEPDESRDTTHAALQSFIECVRTGAKPVVGVKEGRDATLVGLLARTAVYGKRVVTMDEVLAQKA